MKTLLTLTMVLFSLPALPHDSGDKVKAMTFMLVCHGAYENLGQTGKVNKRMDDILKLSTMMTNYEIKNSSNEAVNMVNKSRVTRITTNQIAEHCDKY